MVLRMKDLNEKRKKNLWGSLKNSTFLGGGKGGFTKNQYRVGGLPKKGGPWTVCRFKGGGGLGKREGVVFLKGD